MPIKPVTKQRLGRPFRIRNVRVRPIDLKNEKKRSTALSLLEQHHYLGAPTVLPA